MVRKVTPYSVHNALNVCSCRPHGDHARQITWAQSTDLVDGQLLRHIVWSVSRPFMAQRICIVAFCFQTVTVYGLHNTMPLSRRLCLPACLLVFDSLIVFPLRVSSMSYMCKSGQSQCPIQRVAHSSSSPCTGIMKVSMSETDRKNAMPERFDNRCL